MSRDLYLSCEKCKKRIWIGQGEKTFYRGMPKVMEKLGEFLFSHEKHNLIFISDYDAEFDDSEEWEDIDI